MNKKFKVGDIVVLSGESDLTDLARVLAKENHLFEVTWEYSGAVELRSLSTNVEVRVYSESIKHKKEGEHHEFKN